MCSHHNTSGPIHAGDTIESMDQHGSSSGNPLPENGPPSTSILDSSPPLSMMSVLALEPSRKHVLASADTSDQPSPTHEALLPTSQVKPFLFLLLPAELRNKIYREVLAASKIFCVAPRRRADVHFTSLLCVCRQILSEAASFFYEDNVFFFPHDLIKGPSILEALTNDYYLPLDTLMTLQNLKIEIEVRPAVYSSCIMADPTSAPGRITEFQAGTPSRAQ